MAAGSSTSHTGSPASIMVSQLPTNKLLGDLKALITGHFANFGRILRYSCAKSAKHGNERIAHIQFSSSNEAHEAWKHGGIMDGHKVIITITEKIPSTKPLAIAPQPRRSTLMSTSASNQDNKVKITESKPEARNRNLQTSLKSYFQQSSPSPKTEDKKSVGITKTVSSPNDVLNAAIGSGSANASLSVPTSKDSDVKENKVDSKQACPAKNLLNVKENKIDTKPSACNQLVTYQANNLQTASTGNTRLVPTFGTNLAPRRTKSLREILNLDMSQMKVVKTTSASDVLALQYYTNPQPFALSLMFGNKIPGNLVMPVRSLMESVKPGMEIDESTIIMIWNTILKSVLSREVQKLANAVLQEALIDHFVSETFQQLEEVVTNELITESVENETEREVDLMICCDEVVEAMLGLVCREHIEEAFAEDLRVERLLSKGVNCCFRKLTSLVVPELVAEITSSAVLEHLCEEVVDDILESPYFDRHVRVVAGAALRDSLHEMDASDKSYSDSSSSIAEKSLKALSDRMPSIGSLERTENWLLEHVYNVDEDLDPLETESLSTVGTNTSCSANSSSSPQHDKVQSIKKPTNTPDTAVVEKKQGFFVSLKRKASSFYDYISSKRLKF